MVTSARGLKGSWEWLHFAAQLPAKPLPVNSAAASTLLYSGRCILCGGSVQNNGTAAGSIVLCDGTDATGMPVVIQPLAAAAAGQLALPVQGLLMEIGVFAKITTATILGAVYVIPLAELRHTPPGE